MTLFRGFKGGIVDFVPILVDACRVNWWKNILYITNYFEDEMTVRVFSQFWLVFQGVFFILAYLTCS
jgi:hypothetical protein